MQEILQREFPEASAQDCDIAARLFERINALEVSLPGLRMIQHAELRSRLLYALDKTIDKTVDALVDGGHPSYQPEEKS